MLLLGELLRYIILFLVSVLIAITVDAFVDLRIDGVIVMYVAIIFLSLSLIYDYWCEYKRKESIR